ncbi:hypothetical protein [Aeromonas veronii]|uniref:Uncharacterized protein n=1 Tax=Aeromonas veronii TaxID=654 RepID=A0AAW5MG23_AERVE|nr:hypothetical protein [Aeromonas veronii]MCR4450682.1 hypothetical protein [Aeromonas veronii]
MNAAMPVSVSPSFIPNSEIGIMIANFKGRVECVDYDDDENALNTTRLITERASFVVEVSLYGGITLCISRERISTEYFPLFSERDGKSDNEVDVVYTAAILKANEAYAEQVYNIQWCSDWRSDWYPHESSIADGIKMAWEYLNNQGSSTGDEVSFPFPRIGMATVFDYSFKRWLHHKNMDWVLSVMASRFQSQLSSY